MNEEKILTESHDVAEAMEKYGGGFVQALGKALHRADRENTLKIAEAWPDYWDRYRDMGHE